MPYSVHGMRHVSSACSSKWRGGALVALAGLPVDTVNLQRCFLFKTSAGDQNLALVTSPGTKHSGANQNTATVAVIGLGPGDSDEARAADEQALPVVPTKQSGTVGKEPSNMSMKKAGSLTWGPDHCFLGLACKLKQ